jgi:hypothetical protein
MQDLGLGRRGGTASNVRSATGKEKCVWMVATNELFFPFLVFTIELDFEKIAPWKGQRSKQRPKLHFGNMYVNGVVKR